jgi:hypothetical protein
MQLKGVIASGNILKIDRNADLYAHILSKKWFLRIQWTEYITVSSTRVNICRMKCTYSFEYQIWCLESFIGISVTNGEL